LKLSKPGITPVNICKCQTPRELLVANQHISICKKTAKEKYPRKHPITSRFVDVGPEEYDPTRNLL
jgi:hypothetical protein